MTRGPTAPTPGEAGGEEPPPRRDPAWAGPLTGPPVRLCGRIRAELEDFQVEEIPLFRPSGRGEHVVFQVRKRGMSTFDVLLRVSKGAKVSENDVGYAGLKDTRAVTSQYLSVPRVPPERVLGITHPRFEVLHAARHQAPVKIGHHRGNRFTIRIRGVRRDRIPAARRALEELTRRGMPNAYGSQRFGVRQDGHLLGRAVVDEDWREFVALLLGRPSPQERDPRVIAAREAFDRGDLATCLERFPLKHRVEKRAASALLRGGSPRAAFLGLGRRPRRIWIAAWQSYLFNRILARRVADGTYDRPLPGDLVSLEGSDAIVPVATEAEAGAAASAACRAVPTGPLVGFDLAWADGEPGRLERALLRSEGAEPEAFRSDAVRARGYRRPLTVRVAEASLEDEGDGNVVVRFVLPPGSFATVVLERLIGLPV